MVTASMYKILHRVSSWVFPSSAMDGKIRGLQALSSAGEKLRTKLVPSGLLFETPYRAHMTTQGEEEHSPQVKGFAAVDFCGD